MRIRDGWQQRRIAQATDPRRICSALGFWEIGLLAHDVEVDEGQFLEIAIQAVKLLAIIHDDSPGAILSQLGEDWSEDEWRDWLAWRRATLEQEKAGFEDG